MLFIYASPLPSAKPQLACPVSAGNPGLTSFPNFQAPFQRAQLVNSPLQQGRIRPPEFHRMLYARQVGWSSEIIAKGPKWVGRIWKCAELSGFPVLEICGSCKRRTTPPPTPHSLDLRIPGEGSDTLIFSSEFRSRHGHAPVPWVTTPGWLGEFAPRHALRRGQRPRLTF